MTYGERTSRARAGMKTHYKRNYSLAYVKGFLEAVAALVLMYLWLMILWVFFG